MNGRQRNLTIRTPEGIVFPLAIASPISRFLALAVDKACIYLVCAILASLLSLAGVLAPDLAGAVTMIISFFVSFGYAILMEWRWRGQTLGKRLLRLRVIDAQGLRLQFYQVVIRNILRAVDMIPAFYLVGGLSCLLTERGQRIGDMVAGTIVIQEPILARPNLDQAIPDKYNSFRAYPHLAARLRQNVSPREAGIAVQALLRRKNIDPDARLGLFNSLRRHFEKAVAFPSDAADGLSDEQYVRNAVDILFR